MATKKTKLYDYRQLSSGELNGEDGMGGPMYKATPFEGEGSSFVAGEGKAGAGRGKVSPNAEGKKAGGAIRSASSRADGAAIKGKTRGKMY